MNAPPALRLRATVTDPLDDLLGRVPPGPAFAWLRRDTALVGWGEAVRIDPGTGSERFAATTAELLTHFGASASADGPAPIAFLAFTFDPDRAGSSVVIPEIVLGTTASGGFAIWSGDADEPPATPPQEHAALPRRVRYAGSSLDEVRWLEAVAAATRTIGSGVLDKVVLARDLHVWSEQRLDPRALARQLATRFPDCWTFVHDDFVGATPELLVRRSGTEVASLVLAGTTRRGENPAEDHALGEALLASDKDRREHALSVASVRERLATVTTELEVDPEPQLLRLANLHHLATAVRGTLRTPAPTALDLAGRLHPTAAVCGTPTEAARALLGRLEELDRGRYAGPVGWVDARGDGEIGIALRCAEVHDRRARLFAGAGIVAGSLPEAELEETRVKLRAMQSVLEDTATVSAAPR